MKFLLGLLLTTLVLSGCSQTSYRYQTENNPYQWKGRNIADLEKQWGLPDQTLDARNGSGVYVYNTKSTASFFNSTTTNFNSNSGNQMRGQYNQAGLSCSAIFRTNKQGIITQVAKRGNNCGGEWVPRS